MPTWHLAKLEFVETSFINLHLLQPGILAIMLSSMIQPTVDRSRDLHLPLFPGV
jgi:hypothetical protein